MSLNTNQVSKYLIQFIKFCKQSVWTSDFYRISKYLSLIFSMRPCTPMSQQTNMTKVIQVVHIWITNATKETVRTAYSSFNARAMRGSRRIWISFMLSLPHFDKAQNERFTILNPLRQTEMQESQSRFFHTAAKSKRGKHISVKEK